MPQNNQQKCRNAAEVNGTVAINASAKGIAAGLVQLGISFPAIQAATPSRNTVSSLAPATCFAQINRRTASTSVSAKASASATWMAMERTVNDVNSAGPRAV